MRQIHKQNVKCTMLSVISERGTKGFGNIKAEYLSHRERMTLHLVKFIEDESVRSDS